MSEKTKATSIVLKSRYLSHTTYQPIPERKVITMNFTHHCTACDRTQLIFPSLFTGVTEVEGQPAVAFTCWCGADQTAPLSQGPRVLV